jgi:DNA-binding MarR family transcriptional regulator
MPSVEPRVAADPVEIAGRLRMSAFRLTRLLRQQDDGGLPPTLSAALATIDREGPLTLGDLAAREHVAPPSITKVVDKLEADGLVVRTPAEHDRRVTLVATTAAGRRRVTQNRQLRTAWLAARLEALSPADLAQLDAAADVLERLVTPVDGDDA